MLVISFRIIGFEYLYITFSNGTVEYTVELVLIRTNRALMDSNLYWPGLNALGNYNLKFAHIALYISLHIISRLLRFDSYLVLCGSDLLSCKEHILSIARFFCYLLKLQVLY